MTGSVAMPGLINTHHHFFQTLTRALPRAQRGHLLDWLRLLYPVWSAMSPADLAAATAAATSELLLTGATTTVDHSYLIPHCDFAYLEEEVQAARESGIRLHLVRGSVTSLEGNLAEELTKRLGARAGGIIDDPSRVLQSLRETIQRFHDGSRGAVLTVADRANHANL
jgi:8-oxoguanine deaminase